MKYKLSQPLLTPEIAHMLAREVKRQKILVIRMSKRQLEKTAAICQTIRTKGLPSYLVCKKLPGKLGFGIFLHPEAKPLRKGEIIAPYSGKMEVVVQNAPDDSAYAFAPLCDMVLTKEEQRLFDSQHRYHPRRLYSLNVDAAKEGNFTRFINHSEKPNVIAELFRIPENKVGVLPTPVEVIYLVNKTILPGEQLLVNYEGEDSSYWSALNIKPYPVTPRTFLLRKSGKRGCRVEGALPLPPATPW